jgi:hypothetical protein
MRPLICTPAYGGQVSVEYLTGLLRVWPAVRMSGGDVYFRRDSHIDRARNDCVAHFLAGDFTHLVFIDADVGFSKDAFRRLLGPFDICGGVYPIKHEGAGFPIDIEAIGEPDSRGFAECNELPTGFMCIARHVFDKVDPRTAFDSMRDENGEFLTEDYAFCRRAREAGFKIHCDVRSDLSHVGIKVYRDDFAAACRRRRAA